ncbi:MAG TPA: MBL fold metallo-hydrolase [Polyangiaceae bacterium]|nr:MBL fold metallo-hydrolase [Polyangiaceae bacterium]
MRVIFHGVRGSVPAPGPQTSRYGGNTSCVEVRLSDDSTLALDAGTGLRELGKKLVREGRASPVHLFLSHTHWDHVMGLPFFAPLYDKSNHLLVYPLANEAQERFQRNIFDDIHFPVSVNDIPSKVEFAKPEGQTWRVGSARVTRIQLNHPGGAQGFRVDDDDGTSMAYLTDNEIGAGKTVVTVDDLARFSDGVNLLIHDSQYVPSDMPHKRGFGHSLVEDVLKLGQYAKPKDLVLFHHDPDRSDDALDIIGADAKKWLAEHAKNVGVVVAHEGLALDLAKRG